MQKVKKNQGKRECSAALPAAARPQPPKRGLVKSIIVLIIAYYSL